MARVCDLRFCTASAVLAAVALSVSCLRTSSRPRTIPFCGADPCAGHPPGLLTSYPKALAAVLWVMQNRLGLPLLSGSLDLYPSRATLAVALERRGCTRSLARAIANRLDGVAEPGHILANDSVLRWKQWPARVVFLAHEMTHVAEYALANGRGCSSAQWLCEGFAEWASWRVVDELELSSYGARRHAALVHMREACDRHTFPACWQLIPENTWTRGDERPTNDPKYDQALVATEFLVEVHGLPAVLEYFRLFARSDDALANFRAAFGEDAQRFEAAFQFRLNRLLK